MSLEVKRVVLLQFVQNDREDQADPVDLRNQEEQLLQISLLHLKNFEIQGWRPSNYSIIICSKLIEFES